MLACVAPSLASAQDFEGITPESPSVTTVAPMQPSNNELFTQFASEDTGCRLDRIRLVRSVGNDGAILNVCGTDHIYRIHDGVIVDLGARSDGSFRSTSPSETVRPVTYRTSDDSRIQSTPALWGTGLALLIPAVGIGVGVTSAWSGLAIFDERLESEKMGLVIGISFIPIVGPGIALAQFENIQPVELGFAIGIGAAQLVAWVLIFAGSHRRPVRRVEHARVQFNGTGFSLSF